MGLFSNWKPKTIFGKIIKGGASVIAPVAAAVTGIGAITGLGKGIGVLAGIGGVLAGGKKVIDTVGLKAVNLVTGTTKEERQQVQEQKALTKAEKDKYEQIDRLIKAGATKEAAFAKVGVSMSESANISEALNLSGTTEPSMFDFSNPVLKYGAIAVGIFVLAKILKIVK
jgi:hypothetical protein